MSILVSGGMGFLGSHLTEDLLVKRYDVTVVDDGRTSVLTPEIWKAELGPMWDRLDFYHESIEYHARRGKLGVNIEGIYHLASPVGPAGILPYAGTIAKEIMKSTFAAIGLALGHKCRLVYVSTSEVYNGGQDGLCREQTPCIVPLDRPSARLEYAVGKMAGELAVMNTPGLDWVIVRPFNVAGPRQSRKGGFVLPTFVQQALSGESLTVFGDGSQRRAFTHVLDIVDGLHLAMTTAKPGNVYNLGNSANKTTIINLAERVIDLSGIKYLSSIHRSDYITFTDGKTVHGPLYTEASDKYPDATRAVAELGWKPMRGIDETIMDAIEYERNKQHEH